MKETADNTNRVTNDGNEPRADDERNRRSFMSVLSSMAMALGLTGGYGMFAALAGRFLFPSNSRADRWLFVTELAGVAAGSSLDFLAPGGRRIVITRLSETGSADDFIALSSVCPHLGCRVFWEPHNNRFFCPCHDGAFNPQGKATEGPPAKAGQSLSRYSLKVESGLLFIEVPESPLS